jgi:hypothetical protein
MQKFAVMCPIQGHLCMMLYSLTNESFTALSNSYNRRHKKVKRRKTTQIILSTHQNCLGSPNQSDKQGKGHVPASTSNGG